MEEEYMITPRVKTEPLVAGKMVISVFLFLMFYCLFFYTIRVFVSPKLMLPYGIFVVFTGIFFTLPSGFNKKRKMYESIFLFLKKDRTVYQQSLNVSALKKKETLKMMIERETNEKEG